MDSILIATTAKTLDRASISVSKERFAASTSLDSALMQPSCSIRASIHRVSLRYTGLFLLQPESVCSFGHESTLSRIDIDSLATPMRELEGTTRFRKPRALGCSVPRYVRNATAQGPRLSKPRSSLRLGV